MGSFSSDDEEYRFFDAHENAPSGSDSDTDYCMGPDLSSVFQYDMWIRSPRSVHDRRSEFFNMMGLRVGGVLGDDYGGEDVFKGVMDRIMESGGAVLRNPKFVEEFSSSRTTISSWSESFSDSSRGFGLREDFMCRIGDSGDGVNLVDEDQLLRDEEYENTSASSLSVRQHEEREIEVNGRKETTVKRLKKRWLSKLRSMACIVDTRVGADNLRPDESRPTRGSRVERVKVRHCKKRLNELSGLFKGQDIQAHEGSILSMKFSLDGQYLASAGEDGIIRVWQVVEDERSNEIDIPDIDPSCLYFTVNQLSQLTPLMVEREKMSKSKSMKKTEDSACVIFPPKVFRILEKPIHEFHGHSGEILDLSWSKKNCLLSSSVDKTVRLWRVGCDECLEVFSHSNYVTCVHFNPMDENYFISGSIDGKVRIWVINGCQVVDWIDIKDIATAVSYRPDGQGGIIGSMTGNCRFFSTSDNHFQLESQLCLNSKKKSPFKRITGFEFSPQDPTKVLVTCADSLVRIIHGINVIGKYRGLRNAGNQISATFTSDGKHIISACEDSNVYIWNCNNQDTSSLSQPKTIRSFECFSTDASVAIPWTGLRLGNSENESLAHVWDRNAPNTLHYTPSACFSLDQDFFLEPIPKGSATWPEEKLPSSSPRAVQSSMRKSHYKFFKSSYQSSSNSHVWGLVIVTAGWDGRIRSFLNYGLPVIR